MENPSETGQYKRKEWLQWLIPVGLGILVSIATYFPGWIEGTYSTRIYPAIGHIQRVMFGWVPFSIGDLLYLALGIWLTVKIIKTVVATVRRRITRHKTVRRTFKLARLILWIYIIFNLLWGWNYHRLGLDHQLALPTGRYGSQEVRQVLEEVIGKLNRDRRLISADTTLPARSFPELRQAAVGSYQQAAGQYPFLAYQTTAVKKSMFSRMAQYFGFTGYYNPFTGEAQLRTHLPDVMKPFVLCHEIGHQAGYARENEASFAGYLAAASSTDPYVRYSVYLDLYSSVQSKLLYTSFEEGDTTVVTELRAYSQRLDTLVRFDRRKNREFFRRSQTAFSEQISFAVMAAYEQYLKANAQSAGLKSYDDVVSLVIAYRRKYGHI